MCPLEASIGAEHAASPARRTAVIHDVLSIFLPSNENIDYIK